MYMFAYKVIFEETHTISGYLRFSSFSNPTTLQKDNILYIIYLTLINL